MSGARETVLVEVSPGETRIAFLDEAGRLLELIVERASRPPTIEAICLGRVTRIEKGMDAAFVDIGLPEHAFLDRAAGLHEGEAAIVQVVREAAAGKAPAVRRRVRLAGRYLALLPDGEGVSWPRGSVGGRQRNDVAALLASLARDGEGWAVRTAALDVPAEHLAAEVDRLRARWTAVTTAAPSARAPALLMPAPAATVRVLRDRAGEGGTVIDDRQAFLEAERLVVREMPDLAGSLAHHGDAEALFDRAEVEDQIEAAVARTVALPRGARLTIEATEAMTVIDVDMGGAGERRRTDDAILAVNMAAAAEVARQIRLRNMGGLVVVDFISMRGKGHRRKLVEAQRRLLRDSLVPVDVLGMTPAGLVEITRRRDGPSLGEVLVASELRPVRFSRESVACAALRAVLRTRGAGSLALRAGPEVVAVLRGPLRGAFEEVQRRVGGSLALDIDPGEANFRVESGRRQG